MKKSIDQRIKDQTVVLDNGCWHWGGAKAKKGQPVISYNGETKQVRRLAYELAHGPLPSPRLFVLPKCQDVGCINPEHLFLASRAHAVNNLAAVDSEEERKALPPMPVEYQPKLLTIRGQTKTLEQWLDDPICNVNRNTFLMRLRDIEYYSHPDRERDSYWTLEKALTTPPLRRDSKNPKPKNLPIGPSALQLVGVKRKKLAERN